MVEYTGAAENKPAAWRGEAGELWASMRCDESSQRDNYSAELGKRPPGARVIIVTAIRRQSMACFGI